MLWCHLRSLALLGFPAAALQCSQERGAGQLTPTPDRNTRPQSAAARPGPRSLPVATSTRAAGHAGAGAGAAAAGSASLGTLEPASLRAPARLARGSPPSEDAASRGDAGVSSPQPRLSACRLVLLLCQWERPRPAEGRRSPAQGAWQRRAGGSKPPIASPHRSPPRAPGQQPEAFPAAGAEPGLQKAAEPPGLGQWGQPPAAGSWAGLTGCRLKPQSRFGAGTFLWGESGVARHWLFAGSGIHRAAAASAEAAARGRVLRINAVVCRAEPGWAITQPLPRGCQTTTTPVPTTGAARGGGWWHGPRCSPCCSAGVASPLNSPPLRHEHPHLWAVH